MYLSKHNEILSEHPFSVQFQREMVIGASGVCRDMFSAQSILMALLSSLPLSPRIGPTPVEW